MHATSPKQRARGGSIIVLLVVSLMVFITFMALVVDVGYQYTKKAEFQIQADACAVQALATVVYAYERRTSSTSQTNLPIDSEISVMTSVMQKFGSANGYGSSFFTVASNTFTRNDTSDNVESITIDKTIISSFFLSSIVGVGSFNLGIHAKASRSQSSPAPPRECGFWAKDSVKIHGNSANAIDSYDSRSGDYLSQRIHTDLAGQPYARDMAVGCSDGVFDYNGNINHHGGSSAVGQTTIAGNSFDIFGDVITGGSAQPTSFTGNIHDTLYPAGTSTISVGATVTPLNLTQPAFAEACSLPRAFTYCPAASATSNDNVGHVTGYYDAAQLTTNKVLTNSTGRGPATACDGGSNTKTICLDAGYTYYFKEIDINNTTDLAIRGTSTYKTLIFLDADSCGRNFKIRGQTNFSTSANAANVLFYAGSTTLDLDTACSSGPLLSIAGAGTFSGDLFAPGYDLVIGGGGGPDNGDFYGRIYARTIDIAGNQSFHYDEALGTLGGSSSSLPSQRVILVE
ncbi:MAG: Tad domain-containing protein [Candidatus Wallbacteria bacterium]|nr:Tad domain-containing protein [Candidatus Wallbacteria bacterium]